MNNIPGNIQAILSFFNPFSGVKIFFHLPNTNLLKISDLKTLILFVNDSINVHSKKCHKNEDLKSPFTTVNHANNKIINHYLSLSHKIFYFPPNNIM